MAGALSMYFRGRYKYLGNYIPSPLYREHLDSLVVHKERQAVLVVAEAVLNTIAFTFNTRQRFYEKPVMTNIII
jgi:hypothetical protein